MSKFYAIGIVALLGGLIVLLFQAISSVMTPGVVVWKSITLMSVVDPLYLNWVHAISWDGMKQCLEYLLSLQLYMLLIGSGCLSFLIGGIRK